MSSRQGRPFYPLDNSTAPCFNSSALGSTATLYALANSSERIFQGPSNRAIRVASQGSSAAYYVKLGSSLVVAASSDSLLVLGGVPQVLYVEPSQTYVSFVSSTTVTVNVAVGYGG